MLIDGTFWNELEDVVMILRSLNKAKHQLESDGAQIIYVISRWIKIKDEQEQLYDIDKFLQLDSVLGLEIELLQQFERQTSDIHWAGYFFDSQNAVSHLEPTVQLHVTTFLKRYIGQYTEREWAEILQHFFDFQNRERLFNFTTDLWNPDLVNNPQLWWQYFRSRYYKLATLATQIYSTPTNSVPSEHVFLTINYLHDKFGAKSSVDSVDKNIYVYMNQRKLRRATSQFKTLSDLSEDEIEDLEDEVINLIDAGANLVPPLLWLPLQKWVIFSWSTGKNSYMVSVLPPLLG